MRDRTTRAIRNWMRDMMLGAFIFLMLPITGVPLPPSHRHWTMSEALAGDVIATHAIEVTAPPGPATENAIVAAAQMRYASDPMLMKRIAASLVLGLTFSFLLAFNMSLVRHLRRVRATPRRMPFINR